MKWIKANAHVLRLLLLFFVMTSFIVLSNNKPTIYIIGDSTVRNTNRPQCGWGEMIAEFFDSTQINISNQAMAGRSTRTFVKEKRWDKVLSTLTEGDYVFIQFGHNEGSKPDTSRAGYRGVLRGTGEETVELTWKDGTVETVHTYGWYLKKFIREAKSKGARPIICSMIPRNQFADGKVKRANNDFGKWAKEVAESEGVFFIDLNAITADKYDVLGADEVKKLFHGDHTHTNVEGAKINAASVVQGIRNLSDQIPLVNYLKK
ncbi:rhamnogalacturonan acetylesterase [Lacibacter sp. H407]|uniref:rhamnogalacturonan acetylesterase n=1 Tax=Lacibacter sp. H407 TaxID=3133423 RepID=UPI0030BF27EA